MMIMPGNNTTSLVHYYAGKYPGKIGLLISPDGWRKPPFYMPYALDNGCFIKWEPDKFIKILMRARTLHKPMWIVVPDVVGDAENTLKQWHEWSTKIMSFGYPLAFACQDGMEPQDVPKEAYCCFIGGTTGWKLKNAHRFKNVSQWLHIGRVSTYSRLRWAERIGADSVDGTGYFRGGLNSLQAKQLIAFIEKSNMDLNL